MFGEGEGNSRFARSGIRSVALAYAVRHPSAKAPAVRVAHNEQRATSVSATARVERVQ